MINNAPVSLTRETFLMASTIPNVLFVGCPGLSDRKAVRDGLEQLAHHRVKVFGLIINDAETAARLDSLQQCPKIFAI